jgi:ornithine cyclodeaminase/alanine dehydrogenase-like protein (mu-crystallin family)
LVIIRRKSRDSDNEIYLVRGLKMGKALIIGCGGVATVAIHKCCQNSGVFEEICIASRIKSKCDDLKAKLEKRFVSQVEQNPNVMT